MQDSNSDWAHPVVPDCWANTICFRRPVMYRCEHQWGCISSDFAEGMLVLACNVGLTFSCSWNYRGFHSQGASAKITSLYIHVLGSHSQAVALKQYGFWAVYRYVYSAQRISLVPRPPNARETGNEAMSAWLAVTQTQVGWNLPCYIPGQDHTHTRTHARTHACTHTHHTHTHTCTAKNKTVALSNLGYLSCSFTT